MDFFRETILRLRTGWNIRVQTDGDFVRICKRFKIGVTFMPLSTPGYYYRCNGRDHIAIDSRLKGKKRLFTMFHELGHYLMHAPETGATANFFGVIENSREEQEADAFAWCCLFPLRLALTKTKAELMAEEGYSVREIERRKTIYERYGI